MPKLLPSPSASPAPSQNYFLIVFIVSCAILTGFTYNIYHQAQQSQKANNWLLHNYDVMRYVQRVRVFVVDMETGQRGYLLTRSKAFLEPYSAGVRKLQQAVDELAELVAKDSQDIEQRERVKAIRAHLDLVADALDQQIKQFDAATNRKITVQDLENSRKRMDLVRQDISDFATRQRELLEKYQQDYHAQQRQYYMVLFVGAGLAIGGLVIANLLMMTITARSRQTETALQKTRETYQLLLANLNDGIFDYRPLQGKIIYSDSYARMLGYEPHEVDGTVEGFNTLLHPDDYENVWRNIRSYMQHEVPHYNVTFRLRAKDGTWKWIYSRGIGTWDNHNNFVRILGINTDITAQKQREEELQQLNTDLEGFIYIASHDLRAPLVNLKGFAGEIEHAIRDVTTMLATRDLGLSAADSAKIKQLFEVDIAESLNFIRSGVTRMDMLTSAILDLSRIGRREYRLTQVNIQQVVQRCVDSLHYETNNKNIKIDCDALPVIITDAVAIEQIFGNILDNAIKYMAPERPGLISIRAQDLPWETIFSVEDNGRGILERENQKVFDIFRRASNSQNIRGSGMGLAFIKATLRKLNGRIWFTSKIDEGTTFYFTIPKTTGVSSESALHNQPK